ncbi:MAG: hypothetical protein V3U87_17900 [Methylococcaceae bacterium]
MSQEHNLTDAEVDQITSFKAFFTGKEVKTIDKIFTDKVTDQQWTCVLLALSQPADELREFSHCDPASFKEMLGAISALKENVEALVELADKAYYRLYLSSLQVE